MNITIGDEFGMIFNQQPTTNEETNKMTLEMWLALLHEELDEIQTAYGCGDDVEFRDGLADLRHVLEGLVSFTDLGPLHTIDFYNIYKSNLTKYHSTKKHAESTKEAYESGNHPDKEGIQISCYIEEVPGALGESGGSAWLVKKKNGKVLKPIKTFVYPTLPKRTKAVEFDIYDARNLSIVVNRRKYEFGTDNNFNELIKAFGFDNKVTTSIDHDGKKMISTKLVESMFHLVYDYKHAWLVKNKSEVLAKFSIKYGEISLVEIY